MQSLISTLCELENNIKKNVARGERISYYIPSLWESPAEKPNISSVNPFRFWKKQIRSIIRKDNYNRRTEVHKENPVIYSMSIEISTVFDHNGNGVLDAPINAEGFRETGSFVKSIALLPYLQYLGINTILLLSFSSSGEIPENLREPISGLSSEREFKAFVEAAHWLGMKVLLDVLFIPEQKKQEQVLPLFQKKYDIDGAMPAFCKKQETKNIDTIIQVSRRKNPHFWLWGRGTDIYDQTLYSDYDAVVGPLVLFQRDDQWHKRFIRNLENNKVNIPFFAGPENYDTERIANHTAGMRFSKLLWAIDNFLPALPFINSGFEIGEISSSTEPDPKKNIPQMIKNVKHSWEKPQSLTLWIHRTTKIRKKYERIIINNDPSSFISLETRSSDLLGYIRCDSQGKPVLCIVANLNCRDRRKITIPIKTRKKKVMELLSETEIPVNQGKISLVLTGAMCKILAL